MAKKDKPIVEDRETEAAETSPQKCADLPHVDLKVQTARILQGFFQRVGFDVNQLEKPYPRDLDHLARIRVARWNLDEKRTSHLLRLLPTCVNGVDKQYPRAPLAVQIFITLYFYVTFLRG